MSAFVSLSLIFEPGEVVPVVLLSWSENILGVDGLALLADGIAISMVLWVLVSEINALILPRRKKASFAMSSKLFRSILLLSFVPVANMLLSCSLFKLTDGSISNALFGSLLPGRRKDAGVYNGLELGTEP